MICFKDLSSIIALNVLINFASINGFGKDADNNSSTIQSTLLSRLPYKRLPIDHLLASFENFGTTIDCARSCIDDEKCVIAHMEKKVNCKHYSSLPHDKFQTKEISENSTAVASWSMNFVIEAVHFAGLDVYIMILQNKPRAVNFFKDANFHKSNSFIASHPWTDVFPIDDLDQVWNSDGMIACITQQLNNSNYLLEVCKGVNCRVYEPPDDGSFSGWKHIYKFTNNYDMYSCKLTYTLGTSNFQLIQKMLMPVNPFEADTNYENSDNEFTRSFIRVFYEDDTSAYQMRPRNVYLLHNPKMLMGKKISYDFIHIYNEISGIPVAAFHNHITEPNISINSVPEKVIPIYIP